MIPATVARIVQMKLYLICQNVKSTCLKLYRFPFVLPKQQIWAVKAWTPQDLWWWAVVCLAAITLGCEVGLPWIVVSGLSSTSHTWTDICGLLRPKKTHWALCQVPSSIPEHGWVWPLMITLICTCSTSHVRFSSNFPVILASSLPGMLFTRLGEHSGNLSTYI